MKIVMLMNSSQACFYFRRELMGCLLSRGHEIHAICGDDSFGPKIKEIGVNFWHIPIVNRSVDVFGSFIFRRKLRKLLLDLRPDVFFSFQIKPIAYGNHVAKKAKIPHIFCMVEGLGDGFSRQSLKYRMAELYLSHKLKQCFRVAESCFVMNQEDIDFFVEQKIMEKKKAILINGTGIDPCEYPYVKMTNFNSVVMISRLIKSKGVLDFCEAAALCKKQRPDLEFSLIGHESDITKEDLLRFINSGAINYLGAVPDLHRSLKEMTVFVLPTYYNEGFPRSILEAMATGRPVITTNTKGCNVEVEEGVNGVFVPPKNPQELATAILRLCNNKEKLIKFGLNGRERAEKLFNATNISNYIVNIVEGKTNREDYP